MLQCLDMAALGRRAVAPNPMVGAVIVRDGDIIGKGYHHEHGGDHAEVEALNSVSDPSLIKGSTIYVNLEPCVHHGNTPPCCDRIIESGISRVVVASTDPNELVNGRGVEKLRAAGVEVMTGVLEEEELNLNMRFRTFHQEQRPYIILKWARSADGFIDIDRKAGQRGQYRITGEESARLVHQWRAEEGAILIGTNTALNDDPSLTVRLVEGRNPLRCVIDLENRLPEDLKLFTDGIPTVLYTRKIRDLGPVVRCALVHSRENVVEAILRDLFDNSILSLIVEGGRELLTSFLDKGLWDEARVLVSERELGSGLREPSFDLKKCIESKAGKDRVLICRKH